MSDLTQAVTAGISQAITSICNDLVTATVDSARGQAEKLLVEFQIGFGKYLERNYERCSKVKTLLHRYEPIEIESAYVPPRLKFGRHTINQRSFIDLLKKRHKTVIVGMAGSGKSMLLKHLFVSFYRTPIGRLPIFIELRHLNNMTGKTIHDYAHEQISAIVRRFTREQFDYGLQRGTFILMLDGLDELDYSQRDAYCDEILHLAYQHPVYTVHYFESTR
jgi:predicted NACHT family NTPase